MIESEEQSSDRSVSKGKGFRGAASKERLLIRQDRKGVNTRPALAGSPLLAR